MGAIASVSGGSIIAAHLAECIRFWPAPGERIDPEVWEYEVAAPLRAFTRHNLRTGPLLTSLIPWNLPKPETAVVALAARYEAITRLRLPELPERPRFIFCATDMVFGVNWLHQGQSRRLPGRLPAHGSGLARGTRRVSLVVLSSGLQPVALAS